MEQILTVIRFLKNHPISTIIWLITILMWILYILGVHKAGSWLLITAVSIFCLIMISGSQKDKIDRLQKELDKYKI